YYAHDHLYSPVAVFGSAGTPYERYEYDVYGEVTIWDGTFTATRTASNCQNPYTFTGRRLDLLDPDGAGSYQLKLMDYRARSYDPETGRFMQRDPLGVNPIYAFGQSYTYYDGMSLYEYAKSNSLLNADPSGLRRRRRSEERNRRRIINLDMFDERGQELFSNWLSGDYTEITYTEGVWGEYMMANTILTPNLCNRVRSDAISRTSSGQINNNFAAAIENGYFTGYEMLHGTNATVGGFTMVGSATVQRDAACCYLIDYAITYTWNDIIDPNPRYRDDIILDWIFELFYDPQDYVVHIVWTQNAKVKVCNRRIVEFEGYPCGDE
ncbi:MAG: hypothetical protein LLF76_01485, partial [Planctomycetaceae bacterium]|nr:hypothetical protein [Planctomycetaceae bacterium]